MILLPERQLIGPKKLPVFLHVCFGINNQLVYDGYIHGCAELR